MESDSTEDSSESDEEQQNKQTTSPVEIDGKSAAKYARLSKGELYKPPTNEEIQQLKETENLFHSSLFRMQVRCFSP